MKFTKNPKYSYFSLSNCIRILTADSVEKARSGHPGMPLGMADIMTVLVFNFLKFNPKDPTWFNRDRLILSNGHGSMLLYAFYYLTGFNNFTLEDLKNFRQLNSKTPGHPEYGAYSAIETTTGPLGQGFAVSVGMAIAGKKYQQKLGENICNYKIYCTVGDGCLMEGISYEAASIAGHLSLNNLIVLFDDNKISIDGSTDLTVSEDHLKKFQALGWNVQEINGHDFEQINAALEIAQNSNKPSFIACKTQIAKGASPNKVGTAEAHGAPLGQGEINLLRENFNLQGESFFILQELLDIWQEAGQKKQPIYDKWFEEFNKLSRDEKSYLETPKLDLKFLREIPLIKLEEATRVSSGRILEKLLGNSEKIIYGSADLSLSNNLKSKSNHVITKNDFSGNFIHYGVREHAMAAIMNGLSLSGFLAIGGSFFIFTDYMKPSVRLAALMHRQVIYVMTHDSIGVGEDGPTHQPIEQLAALRAMPNLRVFRPADFVEALECWECALNYTTGPSMLVLTRQNVPQVRSEVRDENLASYGAYEVVEDYSPLTQLDITIFATGSELSLAMSTAQTLKESNLKVRVISIPCFELFFQQDQEYIRNILKAPGLKVAIEAASSFGWHRIIGENGMFFGVEEFGRSAPAKVLYEYFGLTAENIAEKIKEGIK